MKQWMKMYKWQLILSTAFSLVYTITGLILWNQLPEQMVSHWGADGSPDGMADKGFVVFGIGGILLGLHILLLFLFSLDKNARTQNKKAASIICWLVPWISAFVAATVYPLAMGENPDPLRLLPGLVSVMFICLGNVMPKVTKNRTMGIKLSWTLGNEENWNKTHRFAGKVWFASGVVLLICALIPTKLSIWLTVGLIAVAVILPVVYSYGIYREHKKQGIVYDKLTKTKADKIALRISTIVVPLILVGVAVLMFTGNISYTLEDGKLEITATYHSDLTVELDTVDSVTLVEEFEGGFRQIGFASARLSLGQFTNDDLGSYTCYRYVGCDRVIVLTKADQTLVINCATEEETKALFEKLQDHIQ